MRDFEYNFLQGRKSPMDKIMRIRTKGWMQPNYSAIFNMFGNLATIEQINYHKSHQKGWKYLLDELNYQLPLIVKHKIKNGIDTKFIF
tara:strand:+ start:296 stop:559 length:264 start_codon:yes stop_codon:yes gene_type:complete